CPYCAQAAPALRELAKAYSDDIQVTFKSFPLPFHSRARLAHEAALEAASQGKCWEMHDLLFANQAKLDRASRIQYALKIGLDQERFEKALDGMVHQSSVEQDLHEGQAYGVNSTPTFFVNG